MPQAGEIISHWYHLFDNYNTSAAKFYEDVESAVKAREPPSVTFSRVEHGEGGILAAKREYCRVAYRKLTFDICAAPFGKGYFISWWLVQQPANPLMALIGCFGLIVAPLIVCSLLLTVFHAPLWLVLVAIPGTWWLLGTAIRAGTMDLEEMVMDMPGLGPVYTFIFRPATYYKVDTTLMFQETVHRSVLEVLDCLQNTQGLRALSEAERVPKMRDVLR